MTPALAPGHELALDLLDGVRPGDDEAHLAIDAELRGRSTDPAVHAAALLLGFDARGPLGLKRSSAKYWILGLDELIEAGRLEAAAYAAPRLSRAFPRMPYLDHMALVFRKLPRPTRNGREPFVEDPDNDVQVVTMPGADTVLLAFCGARNRIGLSVNLMDRWFARLGTHVVYLRDQQRVGFSRGIPALGHNVATTVQGLTTLVLDIGARRIVCTGNSAGGSGALRYARALCAERVLAMAPITGGPEFAELVTPDLPPGAPPPWRDLVPLYREDAGVRVRILYGEDNQGDRQQSLRMAGLPNVTVEAVPKLDSHHLVGGLLRAGRLDHELGWLISNDDR